RYCRCGSSDWNRGGVVERDITETSGRSLSYHAKVSITMGESSNPASVKVTQTESCPHVLLSFSCMDGSGKSTQIDNLCNQLTEAGLPFVRLAFWDNVVAFPRWRAGFSHKFLKSDGGVGAPGKPVNRNDKNNRAWYLILARSALFIFDAINLRRVVGKCKVEGARIIVFDRYIFDQLATLPL